jgi:glycosyltransferase involved in cell wall biosynthesis
MSGEYPDNLENRRGGGFSLILDMLDFMENKRDIDFHFLTIVEGRKTLKIEQKNGITYYFLPKSQFPTIFAFLTTDKNRVRNLIKKINPDILHTHGITHPSTIVGLKIKKPHILTIHGIVAKEKKGWGGIMGRIKGVIKSYYEKKVITHIRHTIAISEYVKNEVLRLYPESKSKYYVYNAGITKDRLNPKESSDDGSHILFVGGIEERKGLIHLLKAIRIINENNPNIILDIIGRVREKETYNNLLNFVEKNNLSNKVHFHHGVSDKQLDTFYQNCTIFVLPSLEESLGIVTLEAMSYGKPVILSNTSVNPTIVTDSKNGMLARYGDPIDFAKKIQLLLDSKKLRKQLGKEAKKRVLDFTMDNHVEQVYQLYKKLGKNN